jgi:hypothetical protein
MIRIADLLDCDFYGPVVSGPVDELVEIGNDDPDIVFRELTEYIATDGITAEYERLFAALAAAPKSPDGGTGVWISGYFGSGKSSFAKNAGYVLADCEVRLPGRPPSEAAGRNRPGADSRGHVPGPAARSGLCGRPGYRGT